MKPGLNYLLVINTFVLILMATSKTCNSSQNLSTNFSANVLDVTCQITIDDGGEVRLPVITKNYFNSDDGSPNRYTPGDYESGKSFAVHLTNCPTSGVYTPNKIHFSFKPQTGQYPSTTKQVFINEISPSAGGASNVGIVVFSEKNKTNVLNTDGSSDVIYNTEGSGTGYLTTYLFDARYQNYGDITTGNITSHIELSATYE